MTEPLTETPRPFGSFLSKLSQVPADEVLAFVTKHCALERYPRGELFTRLGDTSHRLGFVLEGLFRVYYTDSEGKQHVRNFCKEGVPIGSYATVLSGQPAHVDIEALEDSTVIQFGYGALLRQFERGAAWERLGRRIAEEHYISRERREHALLQLDAPARFKLFHEEFPGLASRLSGSDVASYIGVRPETLSRLRRKLVSRG
jgi:CRP-like cAMP-binding protein